MSSSPAVTVAPHLPASPMASRRPAASAGGLSVGQRRGVIGVIAVAHVGAIWAVLQVPAVRDAVIEAAPMFVELLAPPAPPAPPPPPPPVMPVIKAPPPTVIAAPAAAPSPAAFEVAPPPEVPPPPAPPVQMQPVEAPPAPPAPPSPPKMIPASAIEYLGNTPLDYPRASQRLKEAGTVTLRVLIDERGVPASVTVAKSSGFPRLDEAGVSSVKKWRFKPYIENAQPMSGWALIPVIFELEK